MSAIIPNIPSYATPNPNPIDASQYSHGIGGLQDGSAFELAGAAAPVTGMISQATDSTYQQVGVPMNEATNAVLATTMQPEISLPFHCEVCNISCNTKDAVAHQQGKKHLKSVKKLAELSANAPQMVPPQPPPVANETLLGELENKKLRLLQNGATPETLLYCEICNVICNNQDGFQKHIASKKHSAKLIIQQANPNAVFDATSDSSSASQKKPDTFPCEICKITCTSHELLKMHIAGKKHLKKVKDLGQIPNLPLTPSASQDTLPTNPGVNPESNEDKTVNLLGPEPLNLPLTPIASQDTPLIIPVVNSESNEDTTVNFPLTPIVSQDTPPISKSVVNTESNEGKTVNSHGVKSFCGVCGISCDTDEVLKVHRTGKKHRKNLEKSEQLIGPKPALATEPAETPKIIGPLKEEGETVNSNGRKRKGGKGGGDEDVEAKKLRVLQSGTASDAVQICTLCNVVCNSPKVFISHLAGQKHVAMAVKQAESQAGATGQVS